MVDTLNDIAESAAARLGSALVARSLAYGELTLTVEAARIVEVLTTLRDDPELRFVSFIDICGADYPARERRFDVVYHLLSPTRNARVRIKLETDETTPVPSSVDVFPGATWFER